MTTTPTEIAAIRDALARGPTGAQMQDTWIAVNGGAVMLNSGRPVWAKIAYCEREQNAAYIATVNPTAMTAVLSHIDSVTTERDAARQALIDAADTARNFPSNTCGASRHAQMVGEALVNGEPYAVEGQDKAHIGESILSVVASLYTARTERDAAIARAEAAEKDDLAILQVVRRELDENDRGNAPGHGHDVPGIWDNDNGELAGKPCAWCLAWRKFTALIDRQDAALAAKGETP